MFLCHFTRLHTRKALPIENGEYLSFYYTGWIPFFQGLPAKFRICLVIPGKPVYNKIDMVYPFGTQKNLSERTDTFVQD